MLIYAFFLVYHRWTREWVWLRVPSSFSTFLDLEEGTSDRTEIFTTDRAPKITRHVFEGKKISEDFAGFF
jgi:hypothetical protein